MLTYSCWELFMESLFLLRNNTLSLTVLLNKGALMSGSEPWKRAQLYGNRRGQGSLVVCVCGFVWCCTQPDNASTPTHSRLPTILTPSNALQLCSFLLPTAADVSHKSCKIQVRHTKIVLKPTEKIC